jgi:hypothetical protein
MAEARIVLRLFDKTAKGLGSARKGLNSLAKKIGGAKTALLGLVGAAGFGALIKSSLASNDALAKTADKIGITTEALVGLRHAAELTGVASNTMDMALQRMTRRVAEAAQGSGEAVGALAELGLNAKELGALPLDQQMGKIADAMGGVEKQSDKVRLAMKLFDSEGVALVNTLAGGSAGLTEMAKQTEHLGASISRVDAAQIEAANDAFTKSKLAMTGLTNQLTVALAPILETISTSFFQASMDSADFGNTGQRVADALVSGFAKLRGAIHNVVLIAKIVKLGFMELGVYIASKLTPIIDGFIGVYNKVAKFLGKPLIENGLGDFVDDATDGIQALRVEIANMGMDDPAANIIAAYERIKEESRRTAEVVAANAPGTIIANSSGEATEAETYNNSLRKEGAKDLAAFEAMTGADKTKNVLGNLSKQLAGQKGQSKKLFAISKAASIATAIMSTYEGATKAMSAYPPPLNFAMAAATVAGGLAQVSNIRSQSFEGGGFTGNGSRTGGVDGKGGFNAILHPNETVIDHTMNGGLRSSSGGQNVIVNQTVNISTGVVQTVRAEIQTLMPQIANTVKGAVADARQRGGNYSQALIGA